MDFDCKPERADDTSDQDAVAGLFEDLAETQTMLDTRYDDLKNGKVQLIPGDEAFDRLHQRINARSSQPAATDLEP